MSTSTPDQTREDTKPTPADQNAADARGFPADRVANLSVLIGQTRIDVIGTAHISKQSCQDVRDLMEGNQYDCVAVELCDKRYQTMINETPDLDLWDVIKQGRLAELTTTLAVATYQQRLAEQLGVEPGAELKEAVIQAKQRDLPLICMDREVGITMRRLSDSLPWWKRTALIQLVVVNLFRHDKIDEEQVEELKNTDTMHAMFDEIQEDNDELLTVLLIEREHYMVCKIFEHLKKHPCKRVLAVVGAGHVRGLRMVLRNYQFRPSADRMERTKEYLTEIPKRFRWSRVLPGVIVLVILLGFASGFSQGIGMSLVIDWILINGGLAALGALLAGAHLLTVVSAFIAAPLTSINPMIGAGMVTAAVELSVRKPHVNDLKSLRTDTASWSGWRKNRIARTLLVFVFSTVGSAIGTYVGGFHIFNQIS